MLVRAIVAGLALSAWTSVFADTIRWDADRAVLAGTGCRKDVDAFALASGNDLALIFSNLGVNLPGNDRTLAASRGCIARVNAQIAKGLYIGELTQRLTFGVLKTSGGEVNISARSTFGPASVPLHTVRIPQGSAVNEPILERSRTDHFLVSTPFGRSLCGGRGINVNYAADLKVQGIKNSSRDSVIASIDGLDLRFEVVAALRHCDL